MSAQSGHWGARGAPLGSSPEYTAAWRAIAQPLLQLWLRTGHTMLPLQHTPAEQGHL